jgi:hypothetical protein
MCYFHDNVNDVSKCIRNVDSFCDETIISCCTTRFYISVRIRYSPLQQIFTVWIYEHFECICVHLK